MFKKLTVGSLKPVTVTGNKSTGALNHPHPPSPGVIRFLQKGKVFQAHRIPNGNLLQITLDERQQLEYKCKKGSCGFCKVQILNGSVWLEPPTSKEIKMLTGDLDHGYRLACQTTIKKEQ
jgi:2Fe-2S ferredoxin